MQQTYRVGIVGCGNISATYIRNAPLFRALEITACADLDPALAKARAAEWGVAAMVPADLLASPDIDIVLNLTIPAAHFAVSMAAIKAGKHVYSEKPLALALKDGLALERAAAARKVTVACAPDTFLGGSHQLARKTIDDGRVGRSVVQASSTTTVSPASIASGNVSTSSASSCVIGTLEPSTVADATCTRSPASSTTCAIGRVAFTVSSTDPFRIGVSGS